MIKLDGDHTDFSLNPRGQSTRPNDFFSYYITENDSKDEWIVSAQMEDVSKIRPYGKRHIASLPSLQGGITVLVNFKVGVNIEDVRKLVAYEDDFTGRPVGSVGPNRRAYLA